MLAWIFTAHHADDQAETVLLRALEAAHGSRGRDNSVMGNFRVAVLTRRCPDRRVKLCRP